MENNLETSFYILFRQNLHFRSPLSPVYKIFRVLFWRSCRCIFRNQ